MRPATRSRSSAWPAASRGLATSRSSGATSAPASSRSPSSPTKSCWRRGWIQRCWRTRAMCGRAGCWRPSRTSTPRSSATALSKPRPQTRSNASSSSAAGRPWSRRATTASDTAGPWASSPAWGRTPTATTSSRTAHWPAPSASSRWCWGTTRTTWQAGSPTSSTSPDRASWSRPPARPLWWRCTSPARRCSPANATWRWPAVSPSSCRRRTGMSTARAGSTLPTGTAAHSTLERKARSVAPAWGSSFSSGSLTRWPKGITSSR